VKIGFEPGATYKYPLFGSMAFMRLRMAVSTLLGSRPSDLPWVNPYPGFDPLVPKKTDYAWEALVGFDLERVAIEVEEEKVVHGLIFARASGVVHTGATQDRGSHPRGRIPSAPFSPWA
jgi:hypothetical protein